MAISLGVYPIFRHTHIDSTARFSTEHLLLAVGYSHAPWHVRHINTPIVHSAAHWPLNWDCNPRRNGPRRPEGKASYALIWCLKMEYTVYIPYIPSKSPNVHGNSDYLIHGNRG